MAREHDDRPRKQPARKITPEVIEERGADINGGAGREELDLRAERSDFAVGRAAPRGDPASVREKITRHQAQARRFTEHAAKPAEAQSTEIPGGVTAEQPQIMPTQSVTDYRPDTTEHAPDASERIVPDAPNSAPDASERIAPQPEPVADTAKAPEPPLLPEQEHTSGQPQEISARDYSPDAPAKHTPLSHERPPRSVPNRPGRMRYGGAAAPKGAPKRKQPASPAAAKYQPPGETQPEDAVPAVPDNAPAPVSQDYKTPEPDTEHRADEPPSAEHTKEQPPEGPPPKRDTPLTYERSPRSAEGRPSRLHHGVPPPVPIKAPGHKPPASPTAAKYTPPGETKPDAAPAVSDDRRPATHETVTDTGTASAPDSVSAPARASGDARSVAAGGGSGRGGKAKPGKLRFSGEESAPSTDAEKSDKRPPGRKLEKARHKAEHSAEKLAAAEKKLPKKRHIKLQRTFDEKSAKPKRRLVFEEEVKSERAHIKGPLITRPVKFGANSAIAYGHRKLFQVEHENVGTQAAHKAELIAEGGLRGLYRMHKTAPYHKVERLGARTAKLNVKAAYQQALNDNPKLKSNIFSRMAQKRKIKKRYAKAAREAQKAGKRIKKTASVTGRVIGAVTRFAAGHPVLLLTLGALALIIILISGLFTSCSSMASGVGASLAASSYLASDADVDNAELYYTEWETDLQTQIAAAETEHGGYDEYRYSVGDISHNPYELMAYLTAAHQEFTYPGVEAVLREIFAEQYQLTFTPSVETRYADPDDSNDDGDYEPYDWNILTVALASRPFTDVISPRLTDEQRPHYALLMRSKGARQYAGSPVGFNWLPYVSSYYGYRIHPISGAKDYHMGVDIAIPTGTDILAAHDGVISIGYDSGGYGNYVTLTGEDGLVTQYAHLDSVTAANGQTVAAGDVIAKSGNSGNSTGPHLHYEVIKGGQYLNPLYFSFTNDTGALPVYGDPGIPMGDGSYEALIAEAELYIGYPYRWGGSSPSTSFDCSGFVSYVLTQSGVKDTGRLTAQGLYNICTPVSPEDARPGDLIFYTGTYSSANPVTHVGIFTGGSPGQMLHCGDPIGYTSIETSYWQSHFYSFGRIPD